MQTNNFTITGRVAQDAKVNQFAKSTVARFGIAVSRKNSDDTWTSAFINIEAWRKNDNLTDFDLLKKGQAVEISGFFKPEEYEKDGVKYQKVILVATAWKTVEKADKEQKEKGE